MSKAISRTTITALALVSAAAIAFGAGLTPRAATGAESSCAAAPRDGDGAVAIKHTLTLEGAERVLAAATAEAARLSAGGAIAVVDEGGALIALHRLDGTFAAGAEVSIGKARTAATFRKPTSAFEDSIKGGRSALLGVRDMTPLQGGVPIMHEGFVVGAVGVSGAHSQQEDEQIAKAGAAAIEMTARAAK